MGQALLSSPAGALKEGANTMTTLFPKPMLLSFLVISTGLMMSEGAWAGDLSRYRGFQFGADIATVAKQAGGDPSQAKVIHVRPVLMQEFAWRPQSAGSPSHAEAVKNVVFSFYDGHLFRIAVDYDRYEIDGLTTDDLIEAISATYGSATKPDVLVDSAPGIYGDHEDVLAQWQDSQYRFELVRLSYGHDFRLVGMQKNLEAPVQAAIIEAARLDAQDAPQREAARIAREAETERVRLDRARLANKAKFRP